MKTVDLIPLILLELQDGDKYGFELTKNIETKSNGNIIIKQPTLYTLLKKLEKSKFISSYWQDSEIGGKRHYYRLTENGKLQASTLPSYDELLANSSPNETANEEDLVSSFNLKNDTQEPLETIIPSSAVFDDDTQGKETELSINISNLELIKQDKPEEKFAENKKVEKFTEKTNNSAPVEIKNSLDIEDKFKAIEQQKFFEISDKKCKSENFVRFNDYIDFKTNLEYQQQKLITRRTIFTSFAVSLTMIALILISFFATIKSGRSVMFYTYVALSFVAVVACPAWTIMQTKRNINTSKATKNNHLKLYICLTMVLLTLIISIIVSIAIGKDTLSSILNYNNFANLYAPLLMSTIGFIELLYHKLFVSKLCK